MAKWKSSKILKKQILWCPNHPLPNIVTRAFPHDQFIKSHRAITWQVLTNLRHTLFWMAIWLFTDNNVGKCLFPKMLLSEEVGLHAFSRISGFIKILGISEKWSGGAQRGGFRHRRGNSTAPNPKRIVKRLVWRRNTESKTLPSFLRWFQNA